MCREQYDCTSYLKSKRAIAHDLPKTCYFAFFLWPSIPPAPMPILTTLSPPRPQGARPQTQLPWDNIHSYGQTNRHHGRSNAHGSHGYRQSHRHAYKRGHDHKNAAAITVALAWNSYLRGSHVFNIFVCLQNCLWHSTFTWQLSQNTFFLQTRILFLDIALLASSFLGH